MSYRFAPSPTGTVHLGSIRTAYFNYLLAKADNKTCYLRIDDSDSVRSNKEYEDLMLETLKWVGLDFTFAFRQSERLNRYKEVVSMLLDNGMAYKDTSQGGEAIRFKPMDGYLDGFNSWKDELAGDVKVSQEDKKVINDMVIYKSDGMPVYHFGSVVDDIDLNISVVNRGIDHMSNTARQIALFDHINKCLNKENALPKFAHIGLIMKGGKKMSKRDQGASMKEYIDGNYSPDAVLNTVLRLGWSPSDANFDAHTPLITKDMAEKIFASAGKMRSAPSSFDPNKMEWYNKKYKSLVQK